jgi:DNA helicase-2/ATP-dependent DNA helicase PcrA
VPLNPAGVNQAQTRQHAAAHDQSAAVRLVAGPGTGKSASIEERFFWLLNSGVHPRHIYGVSFTRAASKDLRLRATTYCSLNGAILGANELRVTTLHALALAVLQKANQLGGYPVRPLVLDGWEVTNIFDAEFVMAAGYGRERSEQIRREHEAFWNTGQWNPANYIQPDPPITAAERQGFNQFHQPTTQTYACVLPGEIVRRCVQQINAGLLDAVAELELQDLIVDEYQDLNPLDIEFVEALAQQGGRVFVAGDDDQSIYSFRFASPAGIQDFVLNHPGSGNHVLVACFRSSRNVVAVANALIAHYSPPARIPKTLASLWATALPAVEGVVHRWRFNTADSEAAAIANSCASLIAGGVHPSEIMLLLSNQQRLFAGFKTAFEAAHVPFVPPKEESWMDTQAGRFMLAMLRVVCSGNRDYVAFRLLLGCRRGVGAGTCNQIRERALVNNVNYGDLFLLPIPHGIFDGRQTNALRQAQIVCQELGGWGPLDDLALRKGRLRDLLAAARPAADVAAWDQMANAFPDGMNLQELQDYLWADNGDQQRVLLAAAHARLGLEAPAVENAAGVRVLTMHGAKGLQAKVVFIPALEEYVLPGPHRLASAGLIQEGARLLYVSITRARAAVILSYATGRYYAGAWHAPQPSQYGAHLNGPFLWRGVGLSVGEVQAITGAIGLMA